jgi:tRNA (cmo5U34)-methyltransferase
VTAADGGSRPTPTVEWARPERVREYLGRTIPYRDTAEQLLVDALPARTERVLDLGTGDGRMLALVLGAAPGASGIGTDVSDEMLALARTRFTGNSSVEICCHDLRQPVTAGAPFDVVVSGLAIHHLEDERKRSLFTEIHASLRPGGVFANLDLVAAPNRSVHLTFRAAIGRTRDDPEDRLTKLTDQLGWLEDAGYEEVDCPFKWLELALVIAKRPGAS